MSNINEIEKNIVGSFETNTIKNKIVEGIKTATEQFGVKLVNGEWIGEGSACALGCMLIAANEGTDLETDDQGRYEEMAANLLGVSGDWISAFITGFDAEFRDENVTDDQDAYDLGTQLRMEFKVDETKLEEDEDEEEDDCDCDECLDEEDE